MLRLENMMSFISDTDTAGSPNTFSKHSSTHLFKSAQMSAGRHELDVDPEAKLHKRPNFRLLTFTSCF